MAIEFDETKQRKKLSDIRKKEEEAAVRRLGAELGLEYLDLLSIPVSTEALKLVPLERAKAAGFAVIQRVGKKLQAVAHDPRTPQAQAELKTLEEAGYQVDLFLVSLISLEKAWRMYGEIPTDLARMTGHIDVSAERLTSFEKEISSIDILKAKVEAMQSSTISDLLELVIAGALATSASDVHLEPQEEKVRMRYRIDGVLIDVADITRETYKFLSGRVKLISELKLNIQDKAQDGRFTIKTPDADIEVRISTLPGPYGENIVMRILNPTSIGLTLSDLGMQPWVQAAIEAELKKPNGMVITTGPTGSGKTTSLYAFIKKVHEPGIKIITLEDPIEYHLTGVEQTQIEPDKGYDFATGLRAILRQDPDVILVGEIRDQETAETAMHASLTGHLVFSTLHTNNAAGTIPRLIDLGVKPSIIAPAINVAMAQRLVRRLCEKCKKTEPATAEELREIESQLASLPPGIEKPDIKNLKLAHPAGCEECHGVGYKGRIGVYELILIDDDMERLILKQPSEADVKEAAIRQGQITMRQDAILKIIAGLTDLAEVNRVV